MFGTRNGVFWNAVIGGGRSDLGCPMAITSQSRFYSRRSAGILLLVGVLAGVTVGGGVGVIAASSTKSATVCANKKTNVLRYAKNGKCAKTETKVVLNQTGADGAAGIAGAKGEAGTNGTNGTAGAKGDTGADGISGAAGAKGEAGTNGTNGIAGTNGTNGTAGTNGTNGTNGTAGAKGDTGAAGSSFTARSVCGSDGQTLCAVGVQGPGGGTVFYVDTEGRYSDFDYLEVAPADASSRVVWSTTTPHCGLLVDTDCQTVLLTTSGEALNYLAIGTGRAATAAIVARHVAGSVARVGYAAGLADSYTTPTATDWFLPSKDELNEVCKYARNTGQAAGADTVCAGGALRAGFSGALTGSPSGNYWSSSEDVDLRPDYGFDGDSIGWLSVSWDQNFDYGYQYNRLRDYSFNVRPVRAF